MSAKWRPFCLGLNLLGKIVITKINIMSVIMLFDSANLQAETQLFMDYS